MIITQRFFACVQYKAIDYLGVQGSVAAVDREIESYDIANVQMGEETRRVLSLLEGPMGNAPPF